MKNIASISIALVICLAFLSLSCHKEKLPGPTEEGKNTFGCKINGKNWVPNGGGGFSGLPPVDGGYQGTNDFDTTRNNVFIRAYDKSSSINIYLQSVSRPGTYNLKFNTLDYANVLNPKNYGYYGTNGDGFITTSQSTGTVSISRADTVNKIVSGTFEFTAVNNAGKTIKITDGRFDIKKQ